MSFAGKQAINHRNPINGMTKVPFVHGDRLWGHAFYPSDRTSAYSGWCIQCAVAQRRYRLLLLAS
jgi:hypothetical protein